MAGRFVSGSGVIVGGDGSVQWQVVADNVRNGTVLSGPAGECGCGCEQGGIDEVDGGDFTVTIKVPRTTKDATAFSEALAKAAKLAKKCIGKVGETVTFTLPIESKNPAQVQVTWESAEPSPQKKAASLRRMKQAAAKKAGVKKAATAKKTAAKRR